MPNFDIVKNVELENTFRVSRIMSDFDVQAEHLKKHIVGDIKLPQEWQIGLIVGNSGTGKTTILKELYGGKIEKYEYKAKSVIDDMPQKATVDEIINMFYAVGFGSVPCWLKPYHVLSNGEKMRVDLARTLLSDDFCVFDEFTSVVDRNVAHTLCIALNKCLQKYPNKKLIAVTCHKDVQEWLQPNWIFSTDNMQMVFPDAHVHRKISTSENVNEQNGQNLKIITI